MMTSCDTCGAERASREPPCSRPKCVAERARLREDAAAERRQRRRAARRRGYPIVRVGAWCYYRAEGWGIRRGRVPVAATGPKCEDVVALRLYPAPKLLARRLDGRCGACAAGGTLS